MDYQTFFKHTELPLFVHFFNVYLINFQLFILILNLVFYISTLRYIPSVYTDIYYPLSTIPDMYSSRSLSDISTNYFPAFTSSGKLHGFTIKIYGGSGNDTIQVYACNHVPAKGAVITQGHMDGASHFLILKYIADEMCLRIDTDT